MAESKFQAKVKTWLKQKGCFVMVITVVPGIPDGMPDVLALVPGGGWIALETKAGNPYKKDGTPLKGAFKPLQLPTIEKLDKMYYSRVTWPENWEEIKKELNSII